MAPTSTPTGSSGDSAHSQASQLVLTLQCLCSLHREGTVILLSSAKQALHNAMLRSSPPPELVLGKRTHEHNLNATTLQYATHKKLCPDQCDKLKAFLQDTPMGCQAKLFVCLFLVKNKINTFQLAIPPYQISDELKTNINNYTLAILLSINISAYKSNIPCNHILNILKRYQFDLPVGIEHDYVNWEKITTAIRDSITQNSNIFALAQLCSRVMLMHAIHQECNGGEKYWNLIGQHLVLFFFHDNMLILYHTCRAFGDILKTNRDTYGMGEDYEIGDIVADN
ncbi:hypothetical protein CVT25_002255 [Psilocybe cyanescens]|uniref:Uncharacterized protein n=1 Tax=Psilocybe cyanescens TaxID=93625 RepID=A0A409XWC9_PSICY|nr:hypothetical protein CVT25_002255 [Psilocybe cyanescens]